MASHFASGELDQIQSDCLQRLLREAKLLPDDEKTDLDRLVPDDEKTDLDILVERNTIVNHPPVENSGLQAPTLSVLLWDGKLDDNHSIDKEHVVVPNKPAVSSATSSSSNPRPKASNTAPKTPNWNRWEPDKKDLRQVQKRWAKDLKNSMEMMRKLRKGLHQ